MHRHTGMLKSTRHQRHRLSSITQDPSVGLYASQHGWLGVSLEQYICGRGSPLKLLCRLWHFLARLESEQLLQHSCGKGLQPSARR